MAAFARNRSRGSRSRAAELFETYERLAFGDATIAAYMQREGIEYPYSFDGNFDVVPERNAGEDI